MKAVFEAHKKYTSSAVEKSKNTALLSSAVIIILLASAPRRQVIPWTLLFGFGYTSFCEQYKVDKKSFQQKHKILTTSNNWWRRPR